MSISWYVADTETTGLNSRMHEIFQISIIRASDRVQLTQVIRVEKPQLASYDALRVTGKTLEDLKKGISKFEAINDFEEFVNQDGVEPSHRCLVLHNASFDRNFLQAMWARFNKRFPFDLYLDTIHMYKEMYKNKGIAKQSAKLVDACEYMGIIKKGQSHTAKYDTQHTFLLWKKLSETVDFLPHIKNIPHIIE